MSVASQEGPKYIASLPVAKAAVERGRVSSQTLSTRVKRVKKERASSANLEYWVRF